MKDPFEESTADVDRRGAAQILIGLVVLGVIVSIINPGVRDLLLIVVGIVLLVMLHEAGHYWTARRAGMKVTEFFVGFGPRIWSFRRGETEYGIKAIPAGGYVRILGMSNLEQPEQDPETGKWRHDFRPEDEPRTFRQGSFKNRLIVVLAGVTVNIIIAFLCFFVVLAGRGQDALSTKVTSISKDSAALAAGFEPDDRIVSVDGTRVDRWEELKPLIESHAGVATDFVVVRKGERKTLTATPEKKGDEGFLGVGGPTVVYTDVGFFEAVPESFNFMGDVVAGTGEAFGRLFSPSGVERLGQNLTSDLPAEDSRESIERPRGIIGILDYGSGIIDGNMWTLLLLVGNISLALAIFNLVPLLPFDGGHAVVVGYEWVASKIRRKRVRVDYGKLMPITAAVLIIVLTLSLSIMVLDIRDAVGS